MSPNSSKKPGNNTYVPLFRLCIGIALALTIFFRFYYLDRIPTGLVEDELDYVLNAKAIYHTGGSITTNDWSPWSLTAIPKETPKAEFPYFISVPFVGPFGLSILTSRIGYAICSVLFSLLVGLIAYALFGSSVGLAALFITAINPWSVYYGRTAYDVPIAITAYIASLYMLIVLRGPRLLWTIAPLAIAFYSYIGTKVLFLPFLIISLFGTWHIVHRRRDTVWFGLLGILGVFLFLFFALSINHLEAGKRIDQIFTPFHASVTELVNSQRRMSISTPLTIFFANKAVVYGKLVLTKFLGAFSPSILFTNGEGIATFSLWDHGIFYPTDLIFFLFGIITLYQASPLTLLFFVLLIIVSTFPSVLSTVGTTYVHRSSLMYPLFMILIGYGIVQSMTLVKQSWKKILAGTIIGLYALQIINFAYLYFFRFPYYNSESFGLSQRIYSRYMALNEHMHRPVTNISFSSAGYYRNYLFYNNIPNKDNIPSIREALNIETFRMGYAEFTSTCPAKEDILRGDTTYIISNTSPCKELFVKLPMIVIPSLSDGGSLYMIFNDNVCQSYSLNPYPKEFTLDDFAVEKLSTENFCRKHLIRYTQPLYLPQDKTGSWITAPK